VHIFWGSTELWTITPLVVLVISRKLPMTGAFGKLAIVIVLVLAVKLVTGGLIPVVVIAGTPFLTLTGTAVARSSVSVKGPVTGVVGAVASETG
jgi:hypothetical protein